MNYFRAFFNLLILIELIVGPWWVVASLITLGFFLFGSYVEGTVFSVFVDILYGAPSSLMDSGLFTVIRASFIFTPISIILYYITKELKIHLAI